MEMDARLNNGKTNFQVEKAFRFCVCLRKIESKIWKRKGNARYSLFWAKWYYANGSSYPLTAEIINLFETFFFAVSI